jgi:hypothetical protein
LTENVIIDAGMNERPMANIKEATIPSAVFSIYATLGGLARGALTTVITILF